MALGLPYTRCESSREVCNGASRKGETEGARDGGLTRIRDQHGKLLSKNWYILYYEHGRQIREATGTPIKQRAQALLQKRLGERALGLMPAQDLKRLKYEDIRSALLDEYSLKGRHSLQHHADGSLKVDPLPHLDEFFHSQSAASITTDSIREFIPKRQQDGAEPSTINRNLALLRRMLRLAYQENKIRGVPYFPMLKENPPRRGFVTYEQFAKLLAALPGRVHTLVMFLFWTGCRSGEARQIEWNQVELDKRQILLYDEQTKSGEPRILPLPDELVRLLGLEPKREGRVFYQGGFRRSWQRACVETGLGRWVVGKDGKPLKDRYGGRRYEGLIVHDLRRSAVRNMREEGVDETKIMQISGHKTREVFLRYSIFAAKDLHEAMRRVQAAAKVVEAGATKLLESGEGTGSEPVEGRRQKVNASSASLVT